jgi:oligopeptidase A
MSNPLLDFSGLPRFEEIRTEQVTPAVDQLLTENRELVNRIEAEDAEPTWDGFVQPLEDANERLSRAWGQVSHLNAVMNSPELREAYNGNLPKITEYYADLSQNQRLFEKFKRLRHSAQFEGLTVARKQIVEHELRDFRLGGAELASEERARFKEVQEELATLSSKFSDNLLDATNHYKLYVDRREELAGIPGDVLETARKSAEEDGYQGWKFTLHMPSYLPVMQYAENRTLRESMYRAYVTRASELGSSPEWDNSGVMKRILVLRQEEARLLGYPDYAEVSLVPKMARNAAQVLEFLWDLAQRSRPFAERDLAQLRDFAASEMGLATLEAWDLAYASEKLRLKRYDFSDQEVKQYLPETTVLPGMFGLVEKLYDLGITMADAPVWHPDVKFFRISDRAGRIVGQFYLDLYARASKRGGAWMDDAITRRRTGDGIQAPVAYLNCNFSGPVGDKPALFTHDEVITLFHEFGHGLHHMLTQAEDLSVSGINGVEWDAVELPSQFMENFTWEWEVLAPMTHHVDSGERLPRALFDKMLAAKNFQSGMQALRQLEFALFDMMLHTGFDPDGHKSVLELAEEVRREVAVFTPPPFNRFPHSFSHIFAGGYAAGYYSYKWAEVLSADAYSLFEEEGVTNPAIGKRFWNEVLAVGGSRPALESFVAFRGREPKIDALLRHSGMSP